MYFKNEIVKYHHLDGVILTRKYILIKGGVKKCYYENANTSNFIYKVFITFYNNNKKKRIFGNMLNESSAKS